MPRPASGGRRCRVPGVPGPLNDCPCARPVQWERLSADTQGLTAAARAPSRSRRRATVRGLCGLVLFLSTAHSNLKQPSVFLARSSIRSRIRSMVDCHTYRSAIHLEKPRRTPRANGQARDHRKRGNRVLQILRRERRTQGRSLCSPGCPLQFESRRCCLRRGSAQQLRSFLTGYQANF